MGLLVHEWAVNACMLRVKLVAHEPDVMNA